MSNKLLRQILYAEDEEDIRSITQIALEDIGGFTVKYCTTGQEVLDALHSFTPDLFLLDVMMPVKDGPTVLKEIRQMPQFSSIPTIFMTAKIQPQEISIYKKMGVIDIITKPFDPMLLSEKIKQAWEKHYG